MIEWCIELSVIAEPYKVQECPNWGSNLSKSVAILRGAIEGLDLPLLYSGHVSTCIRGQEESIVVFIWASPATFRQVAAWKVLEDKETLSNHARLLHRVNREKESPSQRRDRNLKKWTQTWSEQQSKSQYGLSHHHLSHQINNIQRETEWSNLAMDSFCNASTHRVCGHTRDGVY